MLGLSLVEAFLMDQITKSHADRAHARYSPSSLEHRELCPGWESKDEETTWASDGEACHEAIQAKLLGDDSKQAAMDSTLAHFVQEFYDYAAPRIAGAEKIVLEERLYHGNPILKEYSFGTPDCYAITGASCQLIDFKAGRRPVTNAEINLQGWAYALAVFDTYPEIQDITVHFVVPRVHRCTSHYTFTRSADYDRMLARVLRTVERALLPEDQKQYRVGWSSCAYCARKAGCDAFGQAMEGIVESSARYEDSEAGRLARKLNMAKLAKDWAEQTEAYVLKKALEEGQEVEGFEIRFSSGRTSCKSAASVAKAISEKISVDKILEIATVPLASLKETYDEATDHQSKSDSDKELMGLLISKDALKTGVETPYLFRLNKN